MQILRNGDNSFYIAYQHGHDAISEYADLNNIGDHRKHIKNTLKYMESDGVEGYKIRKHKVFENVSYTNSKGKSKTKKEYVGTQISYGK